MIIIILNNNYNKNNNIFIDRRYHKSYSLKSTLNYSIFTLWPSMTKTNTTYSYENTLSTDTLTLGHRHKHAWT